MKLIINKSNLDTQFEKAKAEAVLILDKGKTVQFDVKGIKDDRSNQQNRLMWMWLQCISDELKRLGNNRSRLALYHNFLNRYPTYREDSGIVWAITSSDFTVEEMTAFLNEIHEEAATELGLDLPLPEDLEFKRFCEHYEKYL